MLHRRIFAGLFAMLAAGQVAVADDVRTYDENGVTYREVRRVVQRPISETRYEERPYTVYSERLSTEYTPSYRTVYTPVTEYQYEPYVANRWNPFAQPSVAYRYVPRTRWETRNEELQVPITRRELIPEQRVARVPVVTQRFVPEEYTSKTALGASSSTYAVAKPIGGVATMQNDPPRQGEAWQSPDAALMRK